MGSLLVRCPNTFAVIDTGVETDAASLALAWRSTLRFHCPHCNEVHEVRVREAYMQDVLSLEGRSRPSRVVGVRPVSRAPEATNDLLAKWETSRPIRNDGILGLASSPFVSGNRLRPALGRGDRAA
jgi:hypothetical protein